ncbi:hypothetical protein HMPREF9144_2728 [Prevotella pallens ATCC 700821]|uniref:Uncharacterized protein n=1 Tax=Prevotella pallens ATCC 700821 TaxID=997353 RepID=F9DM36_9BACT|nr:hypothetical protein HMPREF9144_2728 [Prevotella pallens ATCC 700821]
MPFCLTYFKTAKAQMLPRSFLNRYYLCNRNNKNYSEWRTK